MQEHVFYFWGHNNKLTVKGYSTSLTDNISMQSDPKMMQREEDVLELNFKKKKIFILIFLFRKVEIYGNCAEFYCISVTSFFLFLPFLPFSPRFLYFV